MSTVSRFVFLVFCISGVAQAQELTREQLIEATSTSQPSASENQPKPPPVQTQTPDAPPIQAAPAQAPAPVVEAAPPVTPATQAAPPLATPVPQPNSAPAVPVYQDQAKQMPNRVRVATIISFNAANEVTFDEMRGSVSGVTGTGEIEFGSQGALGIGLELGQTTPFQWGWNLGGHYEFPRKIDTVSGVINGNPFHGFYTVSPELSIFTVYANAIYRWQSVYVPFGFNLSAPKLKSDTSYTISGAMGLQVGVGFEANPNMSAEFLIKSVAFSLSETEGANFIDYGDTTLTGLQMNLKVRF